MAVYRAMRTPVLGPAACPSVVSAFGVWAPVWVGVRGALAGPGDVVGGAVDRCRRPAGSKSCEIPLRGHAATSPKESTQPRAGTNARRTLQSVADLHGSSARSWSDDRDSRLWLGGFAYLMSGGMYPQSTKVRVESTRKSEAVV